MKKCPFCSEDIQEDAKKCKHCGEWLNGSKAPADPGSSSARAVAKGIKQKELADFNAGALGFVSLVIAVIVGISSKSFWIGLVVFVVPMIFIAKKYYKE